MAADAAVLMSGFIGFPFDVIAADVKMPVTLMGDERRAMLSCLCRGIAGSASVPAAELLFQSLLYRFQAR